MRVAVIGAGLAGLAAACDLADRGAEVTLFERRPWAGGKTYSFVDRATGETIDNGQHVFMGCTTAYRAFLARLGTLRLTKRQERLRVPVFDPRGRRSDLWAANLPAPLHLLPSFLAYRHLSLSEKGRVARAIAALVQSRAGDAELDGQSFAEWLRRRGQTQQEVRRFWDLIVVPTLNCTSAQASAAQAIFVFRQGFLRSAGSGALGLPSVGLSQLHVQPALDALHRAGATFRPGVEVEALRVDKGRVSALQFADHVECFDCYIAALPPRQLLDILPAELRGRLPFVALTRYQYDPIVNLHFWFDAPVAGFDFAAFEGSELQWVFNRSRIERGAQATAPGSAEHLTVSLSAAWDYVDRSRSDLARHFLPEIHRLLPRSRSAHLLRFTATKEPEATFRPAPGIYRPGPVTPVENLYLAGAYTATGWPATMESAVRSGIAAAAAVAAQTAAKAARAPAAVV